MTFRHPPPWAQSGGNYARALREQNLNIDTSPDARSPEEPHLRPDHPPLPHRADSFYSTSLSAPKDHKETHPTVLVGTTPTSPSEPEQTLATFEIHVHEEESSTYIPPTPDEQKRMWYAEHLGMVQAKPADRWGFSSASVSRTPTPDPDREAEIAAAKS